MVFTLGPSAHLGSLATGHGFGTISRSSGIVRFVQGGVVKTFRWTPQRGNPFISVMLNRRHFLAGSAIGGLTMALSCNRNVAVNERDFAKQLAEFNRPYARMVFSPGDPGQVPVTKLSGVPWWPANTPRPTCVDGHKMAFVGQFRIDEIPGVDQPPKLLAFHYCDECTYQGKMSWGWNDKGRQLRYHLTLFSDLDSSVDGLGAVASSSISPQTSELEPGNETLNIEDIWEQFPETAVPGGIPDSDNIVHEERSKFGGWPSWVQHPERPEDEMGNEMHFVCQLDMHDCPNSAWATGYAYIFVSDSVDDDQKAELVIQTT